MKKIKILVNTYKCTKCGRTVYQHVFEDPFEENDALIICIFEGDENHFQAIRSWKAMGFEVDVIYPERKPGSYVRFNPILN